MLRLSCNFNCFRIHMLLYECIKKSHNVRDRYLNNLTILSPIDKSNHLVGIGFSLIQTRIKRYQFSMCFFFHSQLCLFRPFVFACVAAPMLFYKKLFTTLSNIVRRSCVYVVKNSFFILSTC